MQVLRGKVASSGQYANGIVPLLLTRERGLREYQTCYHHTCSDTRVARGRPAHRVQLIVHCDGVHEGLYASSGAANLTRSKNLSRT